jgi:Transcriptional regulator/sugar kinase
MRAYIASDLKELNRSAVFGLIREEGEISKAEISRRSGISAPTVIKIVDYFQELHIVSEAGEGVSALGRKPMLIRLEPGSALSVGVEYDGVHLSVGLVDLSGRPLRLRSTVAPPDLREILGSLLVREILALIELSGADRSQVRGVGIGVPGVVDPVRRAVSLAPLVGVEESVDCGPFLDALEEELGLPTLLENDANAAALGERAARGAGEGDDLVFVELGRGLGAGLVLGGKLRSGPRHAAGEIGYLVLERSLEAGKRGGGWLERRMDLASFWAEAEAAGSPSEESLDRVASLLALGLANICTALDIDRVVVGRAGQESFGPELLAKLGRELAKICPAPISCEAPRSQEPGVTGAAVLAAEAWLKGVFAG